MSDVLSDLLCLAGIRSKKKPSLKIIVNRDGLTEVLDVETLIEFLKCLNRADGLNITVEEPEIKLRESFNAKLLEIKYRRENDVWQCRVNLEEQEFSKESREKIKELVKGRVDTIVEIGLVIWKILRSLSI
jgi:hypothetical protein